MAKAFLLLHLSLLLLTVYGEEQGIVSFAAKPPYHHSTTPAPAPAHYHSTSPAPTPAHHHHGRQHHKNHHSVPPAYPPSHHYNNDHPPSKPPAYSTSQHYNQAHPPSNAPAYPPSHHNAPAYPPSVHHSPSKAPAYPPSHHHHHGYPPSKTPAYPPGHHHHHGHPPSKAPAYPPTHHHHGHPPTAAPPRPPKRPLPRTFVAVQGVVYCKSCKYAGNYTLLGATPILGATVKLQCNNTKYPIVVQGKTDKNGYFLVEAPKTVTNYGAHKCKVSLVSSPLPSCQKPSNLHGGDTGATLRPEKPYTSNKLPYFLYSVGPVAFEPKCY